MKFTSLVEPLKKQINLAEKVSDKKLTLPILGNLLLKPENGQLKISATDLELGLTIILPGKMEDGPGLTVPAKNLSLFLNNLNEEKITLSVKGSIMHLESGEYKADLQGMPVDDFPIIPEVKNSEYIEIDKKDLNEGLTQVINSAGYPVGRPELNSIFLTYKKGDLRLVATNSFRLSEKILKDKIESNLEREIEIIVPIKTAQEVLHIINEGELDKEKVKIYIESSQILFDFGNIKLVSRLIEGNYPKYQNIIPKDFKTNVSIDKFKLLNAAKIASIFASKNNDISLTIDSAANNLVLEARDSNIGNNETTIKGDITGDSLKISFNYRFLIDGLNSLNGDKISFGLNSELSPVRFKSLNSDDYLYILMPLNLNNN